MRSKSIKNKFVKRLLVLLLIVIVLCFAFFFLDKSFGFFKYKKLGDIINVVTIKGLEVKILDNDSSLLNIENGYPIYDSEASELTPFRFSVKNKFSKKVKYSIKVLLDDDKASKCKLDSGVVCPTLSSNYIKFVSRIADNDYSKPMILKDSNSVVISGEIDAGEIIDYSIILWIDQDAGNEIMNHYFFGKIIIEGAAA